MVALTPPKNKRPVNWQFCFGKATSTRNLSQWAIKEPPKCVVSRPVCRWLFKPTSNLSSGALSDCLEAVPVPAKHAAPFGRLLC